MVIIIYYHYFKYSCSIKKKILLSFPTSLSNFIGYYDTLVTYIMANHNFIIIRIHLTLFSIRIINEHLHPYHYLLLYYCCYFYYYLILLIHYNNYCTTLMLYIEWLQQMLLFMVLKLVYNLFGVKSQWMQIANHLKTNLTRL